MHNTNVALQNKAYSPVNLAPSATLSGGTSTYPSQPADPVQPITTIAAEALNLLGNTHYLHSMMSDKITGPSPGTASPNPPDGPMCLEELVNRIYQLAIVLRNEAEFLINRI